MISIDFKIVNISDESGVKDLVVSDNIVSSISDEDNPFNVNDLIIRTINVKPDTSKVIKLTDFIEDVAAISLLYIAGSKLSDKSPVRSIITDDVGTSVESSRYFLADIKDNSSDYTIDMPSQADEYTVIIVIGCK